MFDGVARREWERAERDFRAHPGFYRFRLGSDVVPGEVLFRRFAELGIETIPVPKKAPRKKPA